jgi:hypothetical protein
MQYSATSCIYLIGLYTKEKFTYTCFKNLDLANSFLTREFPDKGSACESRAFFKYINCVTFNTLYYNYLQCFSIKASTFGSPSSFAFAKLAQASLFCFNCNCATPIKR